MGRSGRTCAPQRRRTAPARRSRARTAKCIMLAGLLHWLSTPISGASDHAIAMTLAWHGRLMVLAMGLLTPPLIIVARFFKITPRQDWPRRLGNPFWFVTHRRWGHIVGAIVAVATAFVLIERGWRWPLQNRHTAAGWPV